MCIARQILMAAQFPLQNRHRRLILHKLGHFQPFVKMELSKKFPWGPPFAIMPKMTDFSCLGSLTPEKHSGEFRNNFRAEAR